VGWGGHGRLRLLRLAHGIAIAPYTEKRSVETMIKKVLLVDNNREYRHAMASIVRRFGYDVIQAEEISEATEKSTSDRPDLVMMADGVEVAAWLKTNQFPVKIPIVVYTAQQIESRWTNPC